MGKIIKAHWSKLVMFAAGVFGTALVMTWNASASATAVRMKVDHIEAWTEAHEARASRMNGQRKKEAELTAAFRSQVRVDIALMAQRLGAIETELGQLGKLMRQISTYLAKGPNP